MVTWASSRISITPVPGSMKNARSIGDFETSYLSMLVQQHAEGDEDQGVPAQCLMLLCGRYGVCPRRALMQIRRIPARIHAFQILHQSPNLLQGCSASTAHTLCGREATLTSWRCMIDIEQGTAHWL